MQPYFFPYAGYFRLFVGVEQFVILDDVQFRKGGRIHRTFVPGPNGTSEWLTLPLARHGLETLVKDVAFSREARRVLDARLARFPWIKSARGVLADRLRDYLHGPLDSFVDFVENGLRIVVDELAFDVEIVRSSTLDLPVSDRGEARVLSILKFLKTTRYVNASGGHHLYSPEHFRREGIELCFLVPYGGEFWELLPALMTCSPEAIRNDILSTAETVSA